MINCRIGRAWALLAVLVLACVPACSRAQREKPAAPPAGETLPAKRSALGGLLRLPESAPQYGWDGQESSISLKAPVALVFPRAQEALRGMAFVIKNEQTRLQGASGRIEAAKADKTGAQVSVEEKQPGSTEVRVKIGALGDRTGSERVLEEIQKTMQRAPVKK